MSSPEATRWKQLATQVLSVLGIAAALILIANISIETFASPTFEDKQIYAKIQLAICIYFLFDFFLLWLLAERKLRFFLRNFVFILLAIPYSTLLQYTSFSVSDETLYLVRFLPILRGGTALFILLKILFNNRLTGMFLAYLAMFVAMIYFLTLIFYQFEAHVNVHVQSFPDALWWAAMTVTTLGSNIIPVTTIGKIATTALAAVGMTTLPIFTVYITAIVRDLAPEQMTPAPATPAAAPQPAEADNSAQAPATATAALTTPEPDKPAG